MRKIFYSHTSHVFHVLLYSMCVILFVGLLATVGVNMFVSSIFLSTGTDSTYVQSFHRTNTMLFWGGVGVILFLSTFLITFQRVMHTFSLKKFLYHWCFVVVVALFGIWGIQWIVTSLATAAAKPPPMVQQEILFENRADYNPKPEPIEFAPQAVLKEV